MVPAEVKDLHAGDGFLENIIALYSLLFCSYALTGFVLVLDPCFLSVALTKALPSLLYSLQPEQVKDPLPLVEPTMDTRYTMYALHCF